MTISAKTKIEAKRYFFNGATFQELAVMFKVSPGTVRLWSSKDNWGAKGLDCQDNYLQAQIRLNFLIGKEQKIGNDFREMTALVDVITKLHKQRLLEGTKKRFKKGNFEIDFEEEDKKKKPRRNKANDLSEFTEDEILSKFQEGLFDYQFSLFDNIGQRTRNILKSRQIGLTWYFAREAFVDALISGDNQIFLSASRAQADMFKEYIKEAARIWFEHDLNGKDKIEINTRKGRATLYFLSTSSTTAQSYHGHLYIDEYFWIPKFEVLNKVASAMASHKKWRKTYFSTPSAKSHSAYPFWSGDIFNDRQKLSSKALVKFPEAEQLKEGCLSPDGQYRKVITITDAMKHGCNLFDLNQLKLEYSEGEFKQLFMCEFFDDSQSIFKLAELEKCITDISEWRDYKPDNDRPYAAPVWIGYDPSRVRDGAAIVVIAPPTSINGKFRILERIKMMNQTWLYQTQKMKELTEKYRVEYIGIDITGPGAGVFEQVQQFYPCVTPIYYTIESKTRLVLKAQQIIDENRVLWDASWSDIAAGFMQIKKKVTGTGLITYSGDRSDVVGHADAAWAIMHVLINEGLLLPGTQAQSRVVIA